MNVKEKLLQACRLFAEEKVRNIQRSLNELNDSVGSDSKSTAGDKHETGRAMLHIEQEQIGEQLKQAEELLKSVEKISIQKSSPKIVLGSLVKTNRAAFFIAVSIGKIIIDKSDYYALSPQAPLAQKLMGLSKGDAFKFNGVEYKVDEVL